MSQDVDWTQFCVSNWTSPPDHSPVRLASAKAAVCSAYPRQTVPIAADAALTRFELAEAQSTSSGALIATYRQKADDRKDFR